MTTTEMLQVAGSSGLVTTETSPAASELEPYTNLQASLIGKEGIFSNNLPYQHFMDRTGFFGPPKVQEAYNIIFFFIFGGK